MNFSEYKNKVYSYLGYKNISKSNEIDSLINECLKEVEEISQFKYIYQEFDYLLGFLKEEPYASFLRGCTGYFLSAMTLGVEIDRKIKYYGKTDLVKMAVFDACANAYLEYKSDEFEKTLGDNLTYRFGIGYQGSKLSDLKTLFFILKPEKIGMHLLDSFLMIPQKSMAGIVGIGKRTSIECGNCVLKNKCELKREGKRCKILEKE